VTAPFPDQVGIESHVTNYLPQERAVRAEVQIVDRAGQSFPPGDGLKTTVVARVYNLEEVKQVGTVPRVPLAEGQEVPLTAMLEPRVVTLPLPSMPFGTHAVVAKVYSADDRYRKPFEPSRCYVGQVTFGDLVRIRRSMLEAIYSPTGVGNPMAESEIKGLVQQGAVIAEDDAGQLWIAREVAGGRLDLSQPFSP